MKGLTNTVFTAVAALAAVLVANVAVALALAPLLRFFWNLAASAFGLPLIPLSSSFGVVGLIVVVRSAIKGVQVNVKTRL